MKTTKLMRELLKSDIILINYVCNLLYINTTHFPIWKGVLKLSGLCFIGPYVF